MLILPYVKMFSNASYIWNVIWLKKYNFITLFIDIVSPLRGAVVSTSDS